MFVNFVRLFTLFFCFSCVDSIKVVSKAATDGNTSPSNFNIIENNTDKKFIIFSDDFDDHPDWEANPANYRCAPKFFNNGSSCPVVDIPHGWTGYANGNDQWNSLKGYPNHHTNLRITSEHGRGGIGKSLIKNSESNRPAGTSNYYSDGILLKYLGEDSKGYADIYASFWVKFPNEWQWVTPGSGQMKMARFTHFSGNIQTDDPFVQFPSQGGMNSPSFIFSINNSLKADGSEQWGFRPPLSLRCNPVYHCEDPVYDPKVKEYMVGQPKWADPGAMGDGEWHKIELHAKMNSAPGVADGVAEWWFDGVWQYGTDTHVYIQNGGNANLKFNDFSIGGNWNNWWSPVENASEMDYYIDDVQICTKRCPEN